MFCTQVTFNLHRNLERKVVVLPLSDEDGEILDNCTNGRIQNPGQGCSELLSWRTSTT
jgi:hypothetical protein